MSEQQESGVPPMAPQAAQTRLDQLIRLWTEASEEDRLEFLDWQETGERVPRFTTPLVKEDHLYLQNPRPARASLFIGKMPGFRTHNTADELAFAKAFRYVWKHIPREDRSRMLSYWRPDSCPAGQGSRPVIRLENDDYLKPNLGLCKDEGDMLLFAASLTTLYRYQLAHTIAHELAHVFRHATGDYLKLLDTCGQDASPPPHGGSGAGNCKGGEAAFLRRLEKEWKAFKKANEKETDQVARRWGFPMPKRQEHWQWDVDYW
jgi:hypothetical protein